ncbi:MAG: radical SAM protein [Bacteroidales bacterium]|nr:radical SAM protein [Bacteroidales bacterium]
MASEEQIRNIYITTNVTCNLRCIYCYEDKSSKEIFDVEKAKQRLQKLLSVKTGGSTIVNFHGGEPFLVFDRIRELCEWLWEQELEEPYVFFATTNGTLVHGEIQEWLSKNSHRFIAGLSLDGTRDMQNMNRTNSFDKIDIDFFARTWPRQGVKMTVSPISIDTLADGVAFIHSTGLHRILVNLAYMVNWNDPKFAKIYRRELRKLAAFYKENPDLPLDTIFDLPFKLLVAPDAWKRKWCGAGTAVNAFDIDGRQYPCHLFFESVCGKEKSEGWHDIDFASPDEYVSKECSVCPIYPTCPTCYGANYIERGKIGSRDMSLCRLEKIRTLEVARFTYDRIMNSNDEDRISAEEAAERSITLDALMKIEPLLLSIEKELSDIE